MCVLCILLTNNKTHPLAHTMRKRWKDTWHIQNDLFTRQNWRFSFYITPVTSVCIYSRFYIYTLYIVNGENLMYKMVQRFINIFPITKVFGCYLLSSIITNEKKIKSCFWCVPCQLYHHNISESTVSTIQYPLKHQYISMDGCITIPIL